MVGLRSVALVPPPDHEAERSEGGPTGNNLDRNRKEVRLKVLVQFVSGSEGPTEAETNEPDFGDGKPNARMRYSE